MDPSKSTTQRVFSGVQPSGKLHIGNYIGALSQWRELQYHYDSIFCIVDLHALTLPENVSPIELRAKTREIASLYIACGIDPEKSTIFIQSHVKEHAELAWILNCVTPVPWLQRMTQYKVKASSASAVGMGLLDYPVLQAADILLYRTDFVPVGEDQRQHLELTRDLAQRFNYIFGNILALPEARIPSSGARIMGLDDPEQKMSKSIGASRTGHAIGLLDSPGLIKKSIMRSVTDSGNETRFKHASAGVLNLLTIYQALTKESEESIEDKFAGKGYGYLKREVSEVVIAATDSIRKVFAELSTDKEYIESVLKKGAERSSFIASATMKEVKVATGLG